MKFLRLFNSIKRLEYDFRYDEHALVDRGWGVSYIDFVPRKFFEAIAHLNDSPEEIVLVEDQEYQKEGRTSQVDIQSCLPIISLSNFHKLKRLQVSAHVLFGKYGHVSLDAMYSAWITGLAA